MGPLAAKLSFLTVCLVLLLASSGLTDLIINCIFMGMQSWRRQRLFLLNYLSGAILEVRFFWRGRSWNGTPQSVAVASRQELRASPGMEAPGMGHPEGPCNISWEQTWPLGWLQLWWVSTSSEENTAWKNAQLPTAACAWVPAGCHPNWANTVWRAPQGLIGMKNYRVLITKPTREGGREVRKEAGGLLVLYLFFFFFFF